MDSRDQYDYGWNEKGQRFDALKSGRRQGRVNMIAALCNQNLIAPFTCEGACNRMVFETRERNLFASSTRTWTICSNG
ncbi:MAG: transposase [Nostoc sp.]